MKKIGHLVISICGMITVWLGNSFINADINPFHLSVEGRIGMIIVYVLIQLIAQIVYCGVVY